MMALIFAGLDALEVVAPPPYVFLIGSLFSPFSNCALLIASVILVPQSHNSRKELIGDDKSLLGSIGKSQGWQMQHRACCEIRRAKQDTVPSSLVGVGAWRAWYIG